MNASGDNFDKSASGDDVMAMLMHVFRQAHQEATEDLKDQLEKLRALNERKKALRKYLAALREFKARALSKARENGIDLCKASKRDLLALKKVFEELAHAYEAGEIEYELCIPDRLPPEPVDNFDLLDNEIRRWEEELATLGDDSQLANIDLQNALQKQQQALQMLSNVSKVVHDTNMAVIRKIGG